MINAAWRPILLLSKVSFFLDLLFGRRRLWSVLNLSAFFNMPLRCLLVELPRTVRALNHVLLLSGHFVRKHTNLILKLWIIIQIWILFKFVDLLSQAHCLNELLPFLLPFRHLFGADVVVLC